MEKETLEKLKNLLLEEEKSLKEELLKIAKAKGESWEVKYPELKEETSAGSWKDEESDEVEEFSNWLSVEKVLEEKLNKVKKALAKIEKGSYGICINCKKEIEKERLLANPTAETCVSCLSKNEL